MSDDLDGGDKALLQGIAARREGTEVRFYEPARLLSAEMVAKIEGTLENRKSLARAAYYRLLAADLLPTDVRRALYIDGDIVCTGSLEPLFALDLKGCPVGMCIEPGTSKTRTFNRLNYPPSDGYYNSGVILFDFDAWRKENLTQAMLGYLEQNAQKLVWHDQDLINAVLHGRIFQLDFAYNVGTTCLYVFYWIQEEKNNYYAEDTQYLPKSDWPALRAAVESPRLIHFWGIKPWHRECRHPFAPVWRHFYAQSPWAAEPLKRYSARLPAKARLKRIGRRSLERLGLIEPAAIPYPQEAWMSAQRAMDEISRQSTVDSRQFMG